jgi:hypothetical protein
MVLLQCAGGVRWSVVGVIAVKGGVVVTDEWLGAMLAAPLSKQHTCEPSAEGAERRSHARETLAGHFASNIYPTHSPTPALHTYRGMPHATLPSPGFQAVILCGPGASLSTFTSSPKDIPKALLPIANRPMVWYPLEWCYRMGVTGKIALRSDLSQLTLPSIAQTSP